MMTTKRQSGSLPLAAAVILVLVTAVTGVQLRSSSAIDEADFINAVCRLRHPHLCRVHKELGDGELRSEPLDPVAEYQHSGKVVFQRYEQPIADPVFVDGTNSEQQLTGLESKYD